MANYTLTHLRDIEDQAAANGIPGIEARFARTALEAEDTGLALERILPDSRQPFGHRHKKAEEVYVVLSGSGTLHIEDEEVPVKELDAVRVAPAAARSFSAGPDGLEYLAVGAHHDKDGEILQDFWKDRG